MTRLPTCSMLRNRPAQLPPVHGATTRRPLLSYCSGPCCGESARGGAPRGRTNCTGARRGRVAADRFAGTKASIMSNAISGWSIGTMWPESRTTRAPDSGPAHVAYSNISLIHARPLISELIAARPRQRREAPLHSQMVADQVHVAVVEENRTGLGPSNKRLSVGTTPVLVPQRVVGRVRAPNRCDALSTCNAVLTSGLFMYASTRSWSGGKRLERTASRVVLVRAQTDAPGSSAPLLKHHLKIPALLGHVRAPREFRLQDFSFTTMRAPPVGDDAQARARRAVLVPGVNPRVAQGRALHVPGYSRGRVIQFLDHRGM